MKVNGQDVTTKTIEEVSNLIKGESGKKFSLTIQRGKEEKTVELTTGKIEIESVFSEIIEKNNQKIGYMKISIFASNTDEQFEKHLLKLKKEKITKLIIDVRSNSGGELETVINLTSNFLKKDDVIVQTVSKSKTVKRYSVKDNNEKYDIVVLINGGSASGSEVFAAALNENCGAELIGTTTYGKKNGFVEYTPAREKLFAAQTPQIFDINIYKSAMERAFRELSDWTDDSRIFENDARKVFLTPGKRYNIKITSPEDILIAEALLKGRDSE